MIESAWIGAAIVDHIRPTRYWIRNSSNLCEHVSACLYIYFVGGECTRCTPNRFPSSPSLFNLPTRIWISVWRAGFPRTPSPLCNSGNVMRENAVESRIDTVLPCEYDNDSRLGCRNCIAIHWEWRIQTWHDCKLETIFVLASLCVETVECKFPSGISKIGIRTAYLWNRIGNLISMRTVSKIVSKCSRRGCFCTLSDTDKWKKEEGRRSMSREIHPSK